VTIHRGSVSDIGVVLRRGYQSSEAGRIMA
jgi:hypothetical protein